MERIRVGVIGVDSGVILIADPCYLEGAGFAIMTGDGTYDVNLEVDKFGKRRIIIDL